VVLRDINPAIKGHLQEIGGREILTLIPLLLLVFYIGLQPAVPLSFVQVSIKHLLLQMDGVALMGLR